MKYVGRFAPSPTGPLHFGSLVAAFGSWLDARANHGRWLVRIENLDPPREMTGAIDLILNSLQAHGLHWDGDLLYQSDRLDEYEQSLEQLIEQNHVYACQCTRQQIRAAGGIHSRCQNKPFVTTAPNDFALRLAVESNSRTFNDCYQGERELSDEQANEDFILKRKDGLHAYMLAVVVDDIYQGVTHIIRGDDLAHTSCQQAYLFQCLSYATPVFGHLPLALHSDGHKLSKQTHAAAIDDTTPTHNLWAALKFLNQKIPDNTDDYQLSDLLEWAIAHWQPDQFNGLKSKQAV